MEAVLAIASILPPLILLGAALKLHHRSKLPTLLLTGAILVPLALIPQFTMMVMGAERTQAFLLELFADANDPYKDTSSTVTIDDVEVGQVYMIVMQISYMLPGAALFVFGLGFFLFGKKAANEKRQSLMTQGDVR